MTLLYAFIQSQANSRFIMLKEAVNLRGEAEIKSLTNTKQQAGTPVYRGQSRRLEPLSAPESSGYPLNNLQIYLNCTLI